MSTWRRCKQRYFWKYVKNYVPVAGVGLIKGSACHKAMDEWYRTADDKEAMRIAMDHLTDAEMTLDSSLDKEWDLLQVVLPRYFDWARDNDSFTVEKTEFKFEIDIAGIPVIGYIDGIVKIKDMTWILEHKFLKQVSTGHLDVDAQISLYMLASHKIGLNPYGVLYNIVRMTKGGKAANEPVERIRLFRNIEGLEYIENEITKQLGEMRDFHENVPNVGYMIYRTPVRECAWDCSFFPVCQSINDCGDADIILESFERDFTRDA